MDITRTIHGPQMVILDQLYITEVVLMSTHNLCFGAAVPLSTHNLCFGAKIRKIGIPLHTPVLLYKSAVHGEYTTQTCFRDDSAIKRWWCATSNNECPNDTQ